MNSQVAFDHQREVDDGDAYDNEVYRRVEELLKTRQFDPTNPENVYTALLDLTTDQMRELQSVKEPELHRATAKRIVHDHWAMLAQKQVEREMEESCHRCKGRGCRYCDDTNCD